MEPSDTTPLTRAEAEAQAESNAQPNVITFRVKSERDIVDDGFSWRKYGQKHIKGSLYQRFYYRCRREGCPVKKRIERCGNDPGVVMTNYYGKHNHPTATTNLYDLRTQLIQDSKLQSEKIEAQCPS